MEELAQAIRMQMALSAVLLPSHYVDMYCECAEMVRVVAPWRRKSDAIEFILNISIYVDSIAHSPLTLIVSTHARKDAC